MRNSNKLAKISGICGIVLLVSGSITLAGGHRPYGQPVYLVPVSYAPAPVVFAPAVLAPVAYAPAAYAPAPYGHRLFHKNRAYAYPAASYAPPVATAYAAAPPAYVATPAVVATTYAYTAQPSGSAASPPAAAPAAGKTYSWKLVADDSGNNSAAAPGVDSNLPTFTDLTSAQNDKIQKVASNFLAGSTISAMSPANKKTALVTQITGLYADEKSVEITDITPAANTTIQQLATKLVNGYSNDTQSNPNQGAHAPAGTYQLFLPVVPVVPVVPVRAGHFHRGY